MWPPGTRQPGLYRVGYACKLSVESGWSGKGPCVTIKIALPFLSVLCTAFAETPCERLKLLPLADTTITTAENVAAGPHRFVAQGATAAPQAPIELPAYCRVAAVLKPSPDSLI